MSAKHHILFMFSFFSLFLYLYKTILTAWFWSGTKLGMPKFEIFFYEFPFVCGSVMRKPSFNQIARYSFFISSNSILKNTWASQYILRLSLQLCQPQPYFMHVTMQFMCLRNFQERKLLVVVFIGPDLQLVGKSEHHHHVWIICLLLPSGPFVLKQWHLYKHQTFILCLHVRETLKLRNLGLLNVITEKPTQPLKIPVKTKP